MGISLIEEPIAPTRTGREHDGQYSPTKWSRRSGAVIFAFVAVLVAVMIISGLYRSSRRDDVYTEANRALVEAVEVLPFTAQLPSPLPEGTKLVRILLQEPDDKRGPSIYAIEATYTHVGEANLGGAQARYVRVWQTNDVYIRKQVLDPLGDKLDPQDIDGRQWFRRSGESLDRAAGVSYSTRFDTGITMVVSGPDEQMVLDSIEALTPTTPKNVSAGL